MIEHVLTIRGASATADGVAWAVDSAGLRSAAGQELFDAVFPPGPGRDWYAGLPVGAPLFIVADEALSGVLWEDMVDGDDIPAISRGIVRVVEGSEASTLLNLGVARELQSRIEECVRCYEDACGMFREAGDLRGELQACRCLARAKGAVGDDINAEAYYDRAMEVARELGDRSAQARTLGEMAAHYQDRDCPYVADDLYQEALALFRQIGERHGEADTLNNTALLYTEMGRVAEAKAAAQRALTLYQELEADDGVIAASCNMASVWQRTGEVSLAVETISHALGLSLSREPVTVLRTTTHALEMGYAASLDNDWGLLSNLGQALLAQIDPSVAENPHMGEMGAACAMAQVAFGVMVAAGEVRGDRSNPALAGTAELLSQFDAGSRGFFSLAKWLEDVCDNAPGDLRMV